MIRDVEKAKLGACRTVFQTLFDSLTTAESVDERTWSDFLHIIDGTGRLLFGWPRMDSRESDIFAALDDIAGTLERSKDELAAAAKSLQEALDGPVDEDPTRESLLGEVALLRASWETVDRERTTLQAQLEEARAASSAVIPPPTPRTAQARLETERLAMVARRDEGLYEAIRADRSISYIELAKGTDITDGAIRYHFQTLARRGQLPEDIDSWRIERTSHAVTGENRPSKPGPGMPKGYKQKKPSKRDRQSAELAGALARYESPADRLLGDPPADPEPVLERVHESLQEAVAEQFAETAAIDARPVVMPFPAKSEATWAAACKSPADWTRWRDENAQLSILNRLDRPCDECPLAYATEMFGHGRCNGLPYGAGTFGHPWPPVVQ